MSKIILLPPYPVALEKRFVKSGYLLFLGVHISRYALVNTARCY